MSNEFTAPKVLAHLRMANAIASRYQDNLEKTAAVEEAVKAAVSEAMDALVANERIYEHQKESVMDKLASDHAACIEFIRDLAKHRSATELSTIGKQVGQEKTASARYRPTGGAVANYDETDAGAAFRQKLLG